MVSAPRSVCSRGTKMYTNTENPSDNHKQRRQDTEVNGGTELWARALKKAAQRRWVLK